MFEKIFDKEKRQERKIDRSMRDSADFAEEIIYNKQAELGGEGAHRVNIGKLPNGISAAEYMGRVGISAEIKLHNSIGYTAFVYSPFMSERLTEEHRKLATENGLPDRGKELFIAFEVVPVSSIRALTEELNQPAHPDSTA